MWGRESSSYPVSLNALYGRRDRGDRTPQRRETREADRYGTRDLYGSSHGRPRRRSRERNNVNFESTFSSRPSLFDTSNIFDDISSSRHRQRSTPNHETYESSYRESSHRSSRQSGRNPNPSPSRTTPLDSFGTSKYSSGRLLDSWDTRDRGSTRARMTAYNTSMPAQGRSRTAPSSPGRRNGGHYNQGWGDSLYRTTSTYDDSYRDRHNEPSWASPQKPHRPDPVAATSRRQAYDSGQGSGRRATLDESRLRQSYRHPTLTGSSTTGTSPRERSIRRDRSNSSIIHSHYANTATGNGTRAARPRAATTWDGRTRENPAFSTSTPTRGPELRAGYTPPRSFGDSRQAVTPPQRSARGSSPAGGDAMEVDEAASPAPPTPAPRSVKRKAMQLPSHVPRTLKMAKRERHNIPPDGECLFGAFSHNYNEHCRLSYQKVQPKYVRCAFVKWLTDLKKNPNNASEHEQAILASISEQELIDLLAEKIWNRSAMDIALAVLAEVFDVNVLIYDTRGEFIESSLYQFRMVKNRLQLYFVWSGCHYDATLPEGTAAKRKAEEEARARKLQQSRSAPLSSPSRGAPLRDRTELPRSYVPNTSVNSSSLRNDPYDFTLRRTTSPTYGTSSYRREPARFAF